MTDYEPEPEPEQPAAANAEAADPALTEADEAAQAAIDLDHQDRQLLRALTPAVPELRALLDPEIDCDPVRVAAREALIAIAERVSRICQRDLPADRD